MTTNNLQGTEFNDTLVGTEAPEFIYGLAGDDSLMGNDGRDRLFGGEGNDTLDSGLGNDYVDGGLGNDVYFIDNTLEIIKENANGGDDTVYSSVTYVLGANVENLTFTGAAGIKGTGNNLNNIMTGNSANNIFDGLFGNDTIKGNEGNDTIEGFTGNDSLVGGAGNDRLSDFSGMDIIDGGDGQDLLLSTEGSDTLIGGSGNDNLIGGSGNDILIGGDGQDTFTFKNKGAFESYTTGLDVINDLVIGSDRIFLSKATFTSLTSVVGRGFSNASDFGIVSDDSQVVGAANPLVYNSTNGNLFYNSVQFVTLVGAPTLSASDISLTI